MQTRTASVKQIRPKVVYRSTIIKGNIVFIADAKPHSYSEKYLLNNATVGDKKILKIENDSFHIEGGQVISFADSTNFDFSIIEEQ